MAPATVAPTFRTLSSTARRAPGLPISVALFTAVTTAAALIVTFAVATREPI